MNTVQPEFFYEPKCDFCWFYTPEIAAAIRRPSDDYRPPAPPGRLVSMYVWRHNKFNGENQYLLSDKDLILEVTARFV